MKKTGFTLSELLITLAVIGVVSALVLPSISGFLPDKNKAKIIKYNSELNNVINTILTDDSIYRPYTGYDNSGNTFLTKDGENECAGLGCVIGDFKQILEDRFVSKMQDGSVWTIDDAAASGTYILTVVTDGKTDNQKAFSSTGNNRNINTFYFNIDEYGNVSPGDALTEAFLANYKKMNDRKVDIDNAKSSTTTFYTIKAN